MISRATVVGLMACSLGACANELTPSASFGPTGSISTAAFAGPVHAEAGVPQQMPKKTLSDRILTAIALERVTGLKPDPSRFVPNGI